MIRREITLQCSLLVLSQEAGDAQVDEAAMEWGRKAFDAYAKSLDAAIGWARQCPAALYGAVESRPSAVIFRDGQWQTPGSDTAQA
ncbi:hypothetical protein E3T35_06355 [Cryobacterium sp. TMT1-2-2]|uniref:hypothetical protein n=1 Tax=Cryobacterium sp. TMT1-2-2 TaxID=1259233 RepID=UPI0010697BBC|nr:hypothetical protein [Cryobacterium sp. TMT1-2-2]TFD12905.1 hypothetical protein E3T35_06355 [Cryobacterium sp. TMT1-2-2]